MQFESKWRLKCPPWRTIIIAHWDAKVTLVNRIHTPTVVINTSPCSPARCTALRVRTLSGYDGGLAN